jgi:hypothetical protein
MTPPLARLVRAATGAAVLLGGMGAATAPAIAAPISDGTSNTIQFAVASATPRVAAAPVGGGSAILYNGHAGLGANTH